MTRAEVDYVREATWQMVIATTRHRKQLYMAFVEDDILKELREEIKGHLSNYKKNSDNFNRYAQDSKPQKPI